MDRLFLRVSSLAFSLVCSLVCSSLLAQEAGKPENQEATALLPLRNDLDLAPISGQVDFAQTHVISAQRNVFDPLLVPGRDLLVTFTPFSVLNYSAVSVLLRHQNFTHTIPMTSPQLFPQNAVYDERDTFSGNAIVGSYPTLGTRSFSATIPYGLITSETEFSFMVDNKPYLVGRLNPSKTVFLKSESDGLVLMNIKGCLFKEQSTCKTVLDQFDTENNPVLANVAAREMFSQLPVRQLVLGTGQGYWPYIVARGPDGKPHRYSTSDRNYHEWAEFGDKTLPAKVGMGDYWRAASNLGDKQPGQFVAISGQLLDVPDDIEAFPSGVQASCAGDSCNYPWRPLGFWHETGHALGLPHNTPPRYEQWAYRSYDLKFLPNYHPDPAGYGLEVDYLGYHYFGHVMGALGGPVWPGKPAATASAPRVDEFETLRNESPLIAAEWREAIVPFTHQQMLQIQQRFGSFPEGLQYAGLFDDHRPPPQTVQTPDAPAVMAPSQVIDSGIDQVVHDRGTLLKLLQPGDKPLLKGVPVQTLVVTLADAQHDAEKITQIYPPIISNYGNVFAATASYSAAAVKDFAGVLPVAGPPSSTEAPDAMNLSGSPNNYVLNVHYADGSADGWAIYSGSIAAENVISATINISAQRKPVLVELSRGGVIIDKRRLDNDPLLTSSVVVGAEAGATFINPRFLRSRLNGLCVSRTSNNTLTQQTCNAGDVNQQWSMPPAPAASEIHFALTGPRYDDCLNSNLQMNICIKYLPFAQWSERPDPAHPGSILLYSVRSKGFMTIGPEGKIALQDYSNGPEQSFDIIGSQDLAPLHAILSVGAGGCLTRSGEDIIARPCKNDSSQLWRINPLNEPGELPGPYINIVSLDDTRCLRDGLKLTACQVKNNSDRWSLRDDYLTPGFARLQSLESRTFVTASKDSTFFGQAAYDNTANQLYVLIPATQLQVPTSPSVHAVK
ncbi:Uncharacterized protein ALO68_03140 [Pseudomonas syringae pv. helianthi]|uniref:ToxR activated gene A lipoprotein domain-containing protein n=1 Tax=Pseudomonas syringae pv. helianthi TaxID=251654 RepID=A0A0N8RPV1_9PSED|nr:TagA domain-containing protein [Pseudomonas syringae group genomosp. 7]KPX49415.1 Uncharacterized protein ALO68_03140 [Pseudomonas syringae pv. helianthi]UNB62273.1 hypothetical protein MME54_22005 [Pseudomonas syringae pv. helianthi]